MPSNQTPNYNLSQWVKTDKVLMDDFNADNAAIDAALHGVDGRLAAALRFHPSAEVIAGGLVEAAAKTVELDVSNLDWSRYFLLILDVEFKVSSKLTFTMGLSGETTTRQDTASTTNSTNSMIVTKSLDRLVVLVPVLYDGSRKPTLIGMSGLRSISNYHNALFVGSASDPISNSKKFTFTHSDSFLAGDRVKLWGVM